jgi:hypothetical protein
VHKTTQETVWELGAAELARVRAEAAAAGSPMRDEAPTAAPAAAAAAYTPVWSDEHRCGAAAASDLRPCLASPQLPLCLALSLSLTHTHTLSLSLSPSFPSLISRSAYYFVHKQSQETLWELDADELARVRAEAAAAGLSPLP